MIMMIPILIECDDHNKGDDHDDGGNHDDGDAGQGGANR